MNMLEIDGARGEGGGQILRSALSLSIVTQTPIRLFSIRARRKRPGLMRQHLAAVAAAATVGMAEVQGNRLGSQELLFRPGGVLHGRHTFAVGTAGSATLVLQTILWPLLVTQGRSQLTLEGGTHNPLAPPFEFLDRILFPILRSMGADIDASLVRHGFYPAGGGRFEVTIEGGHTLKPIELHERGALEDRRATAIVSRLPRHICRRELSVVREALSWPESALVPLEVESAGPGNVLLLEVAATHARTLAAGFGERGVPAETVARRAVDELRPWLDADVPVDAHLADQLLIPLALAGEGSAKTLEPTLHTRTNAEIIEMFLPVRVAIGRTGSAWQIEVTPR
jgi:RNA 3'-terminal phosphate cyclase (ATP)